MTRQPAVSHGLSRADAVVTIIVSPRERFEVAIGSLEACLRTADVPFKLVYVDGGSPRPIAEELKRIVTEAGHTYLRFEGYITPNHARNSALPFVDTDYIAFIDNDVAFEPGWLSALVRCAEETGAGLVTPAILVGPASKSPNLQIHHAGGILDLTPTDAGLAMYRRHGFEHESYLAS
ncbi:MAG: glycosyltransferase, partial [Hyphomonas sp.]|nr:glycosyltransferase [Hyphomonas sp.]